MHFKCINAGFWGFVFFFFTTASLLTCLFVGVVAYANEYL